MRKGSQNVKEKNERKGETNGGISAEICDHVMTTPGKERKLDTCVICEC
jgi:hypothetical protein